MKLSDILLNTDLSCDNPSYEIEIATVSTNHEITECDCLFVSLRADRAKEERAIECGCKAILCDGSPRDYQIPVIHAKNVRRAYAEVCFRLSGLDSSKIKMVGITGTNGKTSVARTIYSILNECGHKSGFIGTGKIEIPEQTLSARFYSMTTPDPHILYHALKKMENAGCEYAVMEVSSHSLFYEKVAALRFCLSVFTNLSPEHLDFHNSIDDYYSAKRKIADISDKMVINTDDYYGQMLYNECRCEKVGVGAVQESDVSLKEIKLHGFSGIEYTYYGKDYVFVAKSNLCGIFNIYNSALAVTAAILLGINPCMAKRALAAAKTVAGRFETVCENPTAIIDYAHTPMGFENFMKSLSLAASGRKICVVFGCGGDRDKEKRPAMARVAEKYADKILITSDNSRSEDNEHIIADIISGFSEKAKYSVIANRQEAIKEAVTQAEPNEVIAIVGKGEECYIIDKDGYHPYSDKECVLLAKQELMKRENSEN